MRSVLTQIRIGHQTKRLVADSNCVTELEVNLKTELQLTRRAVREDTGTGARSRQIAANCTGCTGNGLWAPTGCGSTPGTKGVLDNRPDNVLKFAKFNTL